MEITGRVTKNAAVHTLKDNRSVVNFDVALSDGYKDKTTGTWIDRTEFVRCAYWLNTGSAKLLTKGAMVQLYGRMSARAWQGSDGQLRAGLQFQTTAFKVLGRNGKAQEPTQADVQAPPSEKNGDDDLPF